jgi:hypothetical protein
MVLKILTGLVLGGGAGFLVNLVSKHLGSS